MQPKKAPRQREKSPPGRPPYEPTAKDREQAKTLAAMGIPDYDIAKVMGISGPTMRKYFADELEVGRIRATAQVAQSLFRQATDKAKPSVAAAIFWLKARARWSETGSLPTDPPELPEPPPLGKKEQANADAVTAQAGTSWETLLKPPAAPLQ